MRTYPALRIVATLIKVVAVLIATFVLAICTVLAVGAAEESRHPELPLPIIVAAVAAIALGTLMSWAFAELILVFANAGEDLSNINSRLAQTSTMLSGATAATRRRLPSEERPVVNDGRVRDPQQMAAERLHRQRVAENKCVTCGAQLNFARVSIEQKQQCVECEGAVSR